MIYLIEIENPSGVPYVLEYSGGLLWDVVADVEADITFEPHCRISRVWPVDEAPVEVLRAPHLHSPPPA